MNRPSEPFNAEERDLAQRLARLGGPREPAAALDAAILAAARAAVSEPAAAAEAAAEETPADPKVAPLRPRKPAPRWPLGFGLAASVVLAAGIGWRMQIDSENRSEASAAPAAVFHDEAVEAVILEPPLQRMPPPPPPPLADSAAGRANEAQAPAAKAAAAPPAPQFSAAADMEEGLAAAAPPPPAPASPAEAANAAADASLDKVTVTGSRVSSPERAVGAAEYTRTPLHERREQTAQEPKAAAPAGAPTPAASARARGFVADSPPPAEAERDRYDDRPPVSADSPEFRLAWLQRIRALIAKGDNDAARGSLQEFRRRYPDVELPEDLRKLAATLPPPTP